MNNQFSDDDKARVLDSQACGGKAPTPIVEELDRLNGAISSYGIGLDILIDRLTPILGNAQPAPANVVVEGYVPECQIHEYLRIMFNRIDGFNDALRDTIARLQI